MKTPTTPPPEGLAPATGSVVACRCGRQPEANVTTQHYRYSWSCCCGGDEINFLVRSDSQQTANDNWRSLILKKPYKHYIQKLPHPDAHVWVPETPPPLRGERRFHGGCC